MSPPSTQQTQLQHHAYDAINTYLTANSHEIIEIEVLPPALEPPDSLILQDGVNLGLPKKILALAFGHARHLFFAKAPSEVEEERRIAHEATRVMLLFDPEHLTAANYRKRYLLFLKEGDGDGDGFVDAVWAEVRFLNSILTSPLHRQSKSPTLWAHRAWLLAYMIPGLLTSGYDMPAFFAHELDTVMKSGERHPKNYYAWQYARRLVVKRSEVLGSDERSAFVRTSAERVERWCCQHPNDISGWMFLAWLVEEVAMEVRREVVKRVVKYATSVRLANESLWVFVRTVLATGPVGSEARKEVFRVMNEMWKQSQADGTVMLGMRISQTLAWVEKYEQVRERD